VEVNRIGVLGGTFNPIHFGHLYIARNIQRLFSLSQVHFVVATKPPHKIFEDVIPFVHRYAMVSLATANMPSFIPSLVELEPQASPFSVDTMSKIAHCMGRKRCVLYFIAGGDSLLEVKSWREIEKLLKSYNFIFVSRPGIERPDPADVLPASAVSRVLDLTGFRRVQLRQRIEAEQAAKNRIYIVDIGSPDISATRIRSLVAGQERIHRMLPKLVREYIRKLHLYGAR
jgi:nicotinate-nucleotide adenylyltransferase